MTQALVDERTVEQLARRIADLGGRQRARVFHLSWWTDRLLAASTERALVLFAAADRMRKAQQSGSPKRKKGVA